MYILPWRSASVLLASPLEELPLYSSQVLRKLHRAVAAAEVDASATEGVPFLVLFCSSVHSGFKAVRRTS